MKRFLSVVLLFALITVSIVGCGKQKAGEKKQEEIVLQPLTEKLTPATEVAPVAEENSVGLMAFYPNSNENMFALAGTNAFTVYFQNKRIKVGSGLINVFDATTNQLYTSQSAENTDAFVVSAMDEIGKALTGWSDGTKIDIYFDDVFIPGTSYYVLMDAGLFKLGNVESEAVTNSSLITFDVKQYGIDMQHTNLDRDYNVGEVVSFMALVDGKDATMYALKEYDTAFIEASPINGTTDSNISMKFLKPGNPSITVAFYNSGKMVDSITFTFNVVGAQPTEGVSQ